MYTLITDRSISNGQQFGLRYFSVGGGRIQGFSDCLPDNNANSSQVIDLRGLVVMPGLIDIHTHGLMGLDVRGATSQEINQISIHKLREGVTSFFPSTVSAPYEDILHSVNSIKDAIAQRLDGANIRGILLEGPCMNPAYKGAHLEEHLRPIEIEQLLPIIKAAQQATPDGIVNITLAPELEYGLDAIHKLTAMGVNCCIGHTAATFEEAEAAIRAGAKIATHTYNAMSPLQHRNPGVVGAVLTIEDIFAEIICDLVHIHPACVKLLVKAKGSDSVVLVTDSAAPAGLPDGEYMLGDMPITKKDGVTRTAGGSLASSSVGLIDCVRNMHKVVGVPLTDAVTMATSTPARAVGLYDKIGSLEVGKVADIIAIDDDFNVKFVMVGGEGHWFHKNV